MTDFEFEWDPSKDTANQRKHGIAFRLAAQVFDDPWHQTEMDRVEGGEYRWQTVGRIRSTAVLVVAHTYPDGDQSMVIRIISARRATPRERKRYER